MSLRMTTPHIRQGKGCKLCPGDIQGFYRKGGSIKFGGGSSVGKFGVLVAFLRVNVIVKQLAPPLTFYFPKMHPMEILIKPFYSK